MKTRIYKIISLALFVIIIGGIFLIPDNIDAAVRVKGYFRKDGTYVQPHYRSNPDGNPYNNWSFPGNTNPYTGKVAPGNPDTYLKNYNNSGASYTSPTASTPLSVQNNLSSVPDSTLIRRTSGTKVYRITNGKKYWIPTAERFNTFGYKWSDILVVSDNLTDDNEDGTLTYAEGTLVKSPNYPFVWLVGNDSTRKWIISGYIFERCGFKWNNVFTIPEIEIQSLSWTGNNTNGNVTYPSCK